MVHGHVKHRLVIVLGQELFPVKPSHCRCWDHSPLITSCYNSATSSNMITHRPTRSEKRGRKLCNGFSPEKKRFHVSTVSKGVNSNSKLQRVPDMIRTWRLVRWVGKIGGETVVGAVWKEGFVREAGFRSAVTHINYDSSNFLSRPRFFFWHWPMQWQRVACAQSIQKRGSLYLFKKWPHSLLCGAIGHGYRLKNRWQSAPIIGKCMV